MNEHNHHMIHMHLSSLLTMCLLLILTTLPQYSHCESPQPPFDYSVCKERPYNCGTLSNISYPFWGYNRPPQCGGGDPFKLNCHHGNTTILIDSQNFTVKEVNHNSQILRLARTDLALNVCSPQFGNTYLNPTLLWYRPSYTDNVTIFYDCPPTIPDYINDQIFLSNFTCGQAICYYVGDWEYENLNNESQFQSCKRRLQVPNLCTSYDIEQDLNDGFVVNYNVSQVCTECLGIEGDGCNNDGNRIDEDVVNCYYCTDGSHGLHCSPPTITATRMSSIFFPPLLIVCEPHPFNYSVCKEKSYKCGNLSNISYPFWGHNRVAECGGGDSFQLYCNHDNTTSILIGSQNFTVKDINPLSIKVGQTHLALNVCSPQVNDFYFSPTPLLYPSPLGNNITIFYDCPLIQNFPSGYNFKCGHAISYFRVEYVARFIGFPQLQSCKRRLHVRTSVDYGGGDLSLKEVVNEGFEVDYYASQDCTRCLGSEGNCRNDGIEIDEVVAKCYYCSDGSHGLHCSPTKTSSGSSVRGSLRLIKKIFLAVPGGVMGGFMICIIICLRKCTPSTQKLKFWLRIKSDRDIEAFLKSHGALAQRRYKYSELKKVTNSFKVKLGEGGFGAVYKGELLSGCPVAVKILNASKGNGEDFINEVASISRTSHVNIVTLLGFCLEGRKRALIYEFMANGSLDKFIYKKRPETIVSLSWENLYQIAIGIAQGLEYLHRGCNTRILHFDIKPHNILLDENFCPKISDFGLAKLCPRNESIISMSDQRGTIGYVAPEVWNRHFGGISHKSDVYSYGMMLLEMVGERKNINAEASHTSEVYFPDWIYNRLEQGGELRPNGVMATEENEITRRMTVVGLWCVQTFPKDRPSMTRVIDMLEGNMNSLEMPPKPVLSSPIRSMPESITSSSQFG